MSDYILINGDQAIFEVNFQAATVAVRPGTLTASGPATFSSINICVVGDEKSVVVPGCVYSTPTFTTPGSGTITIKKLNDDQVADKTFSRTIPVMLKGSKFQALFTVNDPASDPLEFQDPVPDYDGTGSFETTNGKFKGF